MRLVAFCEAPSDFEITSDLVDRVLRERCPTWVGDTLEAAPEGVRTWVGDGQGRAFFKIHDVYRYAAQRDVRLTYGHFGGGPGAHGALMARTAFLIVRRMVQDGDDIDAVVIVWDMDDDEANRRTGLDQARHEAQPGAAFGVVIGRPNAMREAWVLVGFEPGSDDERVRFADLRRELGRPPHADAHLLDAKHELAVRSPKRVLRVLTGGERDRERRCWMETPLETLIARSADTGLREFLDEVEAHLVPRCLVDLR